MIHFIDVFHRLLVLVTVLFITGTVWIMAWSHAIQAEADQGTWPALPVPASQASLQGDGTHLGN